MSSLKIAVQKSGRLFENSIKLLKDCGISYDNGKDQLKVQVENFPIEIYFLRNSGYSSIRRRWSGRCSHRRRKCTDRKAKRHRNCSEIRLF